MISATEAQGLVLEHARAHALAAKDVPVGESLGLWLTQPVVADRDYPPFDRATMDGFAVRLVHGGRTVRVRGEARPGSPAAEGPDEDHCVEIMTGSPCPPRTEAVVMKEQVQRHEDSATFPNEIALGQNIVHAGAECLRSSVVLPEGARVTPIALGLLAAVGTRNVRVRPRPSLALLVTGDEVVADGSRPGGVEIRDSNGPMLVAMAASLGVKTSTATPVRDTPEALAAALASSASSDVVVLTGGVSAGNYDLVPGALATLGATIVFHKVRQQPGKPIVFAVMGSRMFFGLPGTPLGCHLGFHRYVLPALRALSGADVLHRSEQGRMAISWSTTSDRQQFVLAHAERRDGSWSLSPLVPRGSSDLFTPWQANAYINVPEGTRQLPTGSEASFEWLDTAA